MTGRATGPAASRLRERGKSADPLRGRPGSQATIVHPFPPNRRALRIDEQLGTASIHLGTDVFSRYFMKKKKKKKKTLLISGNRTEREREKTSETHAYNTYKKWKKLVRRSIRSRRIIGFGQYSSIFLVDIFQILISIG